MLSISALLVALPTVARADDDSGDRIVTGWPEPDRTPPLWGTTDLGVGIHGGLDATEGKLGVSIFRDFHFGLGSEIGVGFGGTFGPSATTTMRWGGPIGSHVRLGVQLGLTLADVPQMDRDLGAPALAGFVHPAIFVDVIIGRHLLLRYESGASLLVHPSRYEQIQCSLWASQPPRPCNVNLAADGEIAWLFDL
jgi:hypothetical protein